jgi:hypothetical protein
MVSGISGILLVDEETDFARVLAGMYKGKTEKTLSTCREVNLDHNNQIWILKIDSMSSVAQTAQADFNHLLETFKILD